MTKKSLFLLIGILINLNISATKTYNLTVKIIGINNHSMEGFKVSTIIDDKKEMVGYTDIKGEINIQSLSANRFDVLIEDPTKNYLKNTFSVYKTEKTELVETIQLRLNYLIEEKVFAEIDAKYEDENSLGIQQLNRSKSDVFLNDSIPASPNGGISAFYKYINQTMEYPQDCIEHNIQGKVFVSFIVQTDGTITHVKVVKGVHESLDKEAIRTVRYLPNWIPASTFGKTVQSKVIVPLNFSLN